MNAARGLHRLQQQQKQQRSATTKTDKGTASATLNREPQKQHTRAAAAA